MLTGLVSINALASAPVFYPSAPEQPRIQFLKTINGGNFFLPENPFGDHFLDTPPAPPETADIGLDNQPHADDAEFGAPLPL